MGTVRPSPNQGPRAEGRRPNALVLHYTGMGSGAAAIAWLCDPASQVSCHYVVEEDGHIFQLVAEERRAWHAGRSFWRGEADMNSATIGIEIVNGGHDFGLPAFPDPQIAAVVALCRDIMARHAIPPDGLLAHSDIAPGRKQDPGERFPWQQLHDAGLGLWVPPHLDRSGPVLGPGDAGEPVTALQSALRAYGYGVEVSGQYDTLTEKVVRSFQLRFRPTRPDGLADPATRATLADLLALASGQA